MHMKLSYAKWQPFCLGFSVLKIGQQKWNPNQILEQIQAKWHINASMNWVSIVSHNGLAPIRRQAITWTNADLLSITLTPYMVFPLFATMFAAYAGGILVSFDTATSPFILYKMFRMRDRLIWMKFINMLSVYAQSGRHRRFNWWIIAVLT